MLVIKSSSTVASVPAVLTATSAETHNNSLLTGSSYSHSGYNVQAVPRSGHLQRRSLCSVNSSSAGSRCSSRSSSSSGASQSSATLVKHLGAQTACQRNRESSASPVGAQLADPFELLAQQRANSFSRCNLKQQQQNYNQQSVVFELLDKYLTPTRSYGQKVKQQEQEAAARSQSVSLVRQVKKATVSCESGDSSKLFKFTLAESKRSRAATRVSSCITPTIGAATQHSRAAPEKGTRARLASYVSSVRGSSLSSIQTRFAPSSSSACSASSADSRQHRSLLHAGKRRGAHSSSSLGGSSLLGSLFGADEPAHSTAPSTGSLMNYVRRELGKLLKSL